jgi:IclR family acetate operon transcriptional repressor
LSSTAFHSSERTSGTAGYLARCLDFVDLVSAAPADGLTLSELALRSGVPVSTASRLARLLEERGLASRRPDKRFVPGPALVTLGLRSLRLVDAERYREAVAKLGHSTGESVSVGTLVADEIVLVARHESEHRLRVVASIGDVIAPHRSAMGKAILAHVPPPRRDAILRRAVGDGAPRVSAELADELDRAAAQGYASDEEVFAVGLRCRAAPILGPDGHAAAAISIAGPSSRFTEELAERNVPALLDETRRLSLTGAAR